MPDFAIGDLVVYQNKLYKVIKIYTPNWALEDPFVYGLALVPSDPKEPIEGKLLPIRGKLLVKATEVEITTWKILYE